MDWNFLFNIIIFVLSFPFIILLLFIVLYVVFKLFEFLLELLGGYCGLVFDGFFKVLEFFIPGLAEDPDQEG